MVSDVKNYHISNETLGTEYYLNLNATFSYIWDKDGYSIYPYKDKCYYIKNKYLFSLSLSTLKTRVITKLTFAENNFNYHKYHIFTNKFGIFIYNFGNNNPNESNFLYLIDKSGNVKNLSHHLINKNISSVYIVDNKFYITTYSDDSSRILTEIYNGEIELIKKTDRNKYKYFNYTKFSHHFLKVEEMIQVIDVEKNTCTNLFGSYFDGITFITPGFMSPFFNTYRFSASSSYLVFPAIKYNLKKNNNFVDSLEIEVDEKRTLFSIDLKTNSLLEIDELSTEIEYLFFNSKTNHLVYYDKSKHTLQSRLLPFFSDEMDSISVFDLSHNGASLNEVPFYFDGNEAWYISENSAQKMLNIGEISSNLRSNPVFDRNTAFIKNNDIIVLGNDMAYGGYVEISSIPSSSIRSTLFGKISLGGDFDDIQNCAIEEYEKSLVYLQEEATLYSSKNKIVDAPQFILSYKSALAKGVFSEKGFTVLPGSTINPNFVPSCPQSIIHLREKYSHLLKDNTLISEIEFTSVSSAASFITGSSQNGRVAWKNSQGISLKDLGES